MDTLRTKHFRAESTFARKVFVLYSKTYNTGRNYSHLCLPPGLQSLDSAQMSN